MNSSDPRHPWQRLAAAARHASDDREISAPYGFATRVASRALASPPSSLFARFSLRALGVACLLAVASVAVNYSALTKAFSSEDEALLSDDPVSVLLDS